MHDNTEDLRYTTEASKTRALLYQGLNDINVFVEDANCEYLYETILKRLLKDQYKISAIFGVGGKAAVIESYAEFGKKNNGTKCFYIVDGDFDRYICPEEMVLDDCFIYLKAYNIENYFIDENACISFIKGRLKLKDDTVKSKLAFLDWKNTIVEQASKLFLCYCSIQKYFPSVPTLSRGPYVFIDQKTGYERTDGAFELIREEFSNIDTNLKQHIDTIDRAYKQENGSDYYNLICGKFLLTSLECYLRTITKERINNNDFRWHLVNNFDVEKLAFIRQAIIQIAA